MLHIVLTPLLPIALAPLVLLAGILAKGKLVDYLACTISLVTFAIASLSAYSFIKTLEPLEISVGTFELLADPISLLFSFTVSLMGFLTILYSVKYMEGDGGRARYYFWMLIFVGGMILLVYAANLLILYTGWELVGLSSYFLIGHWYTEPSRVEDAKKVFFMTHLPGEAMLVALIAQLTWIGTSSIESLVSSQGEMLTLIKICLFIAAISKSVQYPFYTWLPAAMAGPTPVSALLHSATMVQAGVYLMARLLIPLYSGEWQMILGTFGGVTLLLSSILALREVDLKKILAYSTICNIGFMFVAFGFGPYGLIAGLFHFFTHAFFKCCLFLGSGVVDKRTHTINIDELGGLYAKMPVTAACFTISALSLAGVPPLSGFVSKWMIYSAGITSSWEHSYLGAFIVILMLGSVLSAAYALRMLHSVFFGSLPRRFEKVTDGPKLMLAPQIFLTAGTVFIGVFPSLPLKFLSHAKYVGKLEVTMASISIPGSAAYSAAMAALLLLASVFVGVAMATVRTRPNVGGMRAKLFGCGEELPPESHLGGEQMLKHALRPLEAWNVLDPDRVWYRLGIPVRGISKLLHSLHSGDIARYTCWIIAWLIIWVMVR